ncbi:MAG: adenosine deaminase [Clostridia bacterium]|nr:adenosine deaminase [Clostridia bacterium]
MKNIPDCLIDLHLHLDGSLSVKTVRELAAMQNITVPESDAEIRKMLTVSPQCRDLNEYLTKFDFPCSLLQTREAISTAVCALENELKSQGLIYAEIRFAPQKHCEKGLTQDEVVRAAIEGIKRCDFKSNLILCCMRGDDNKKENFETVRTAAKYYGKGVCAVDLAGAEALYKTEEFDDVFSLARKLGIKFTIHAGEADGAESVKKALEFGASRIGHGVRSMSDMELAEKLVKEQIALELCPTSNLNTAIYENLSEYPLPEMMKAGIRVTVNTDNMSVSGTTVRRELTNLIETFDLTKTQVKNILLNAVFASFADEETKSVLAEKIKRSFR